MPSDSDDAEPYARQYDHLAASEPVLARLIARWGRHSPFSWLESDEVSHGRGLGGNFDAMVLHILRQQVSLASADAAYDRLTAAIGAVTAERVAALSVERARAAGLTRQKSAYLIDLAIQQRDGMIDLEAMDELSDAEAVAALTAVRGIGRWTAEVFLIAQLHREDILPAADIGIRRAVRIEWGLEGMPSESEVRALGERWAPYRTFAAEALWFSLPEVHGRVG